MLPLEPPYPVDFYAGAVATFAVVLFAKFVTHHVSHKHKSSRDIWCFLHWLCVAAAFVGLAASLVILGEVPFAKEVDKGTGRWIGRWWIGRWAVLVVAGLSGLILAIDVAVFAHSSDEPLVAAQNGNETPADR